jgi:hypothetical protein
MVDGPADDVAAAVDSDLLTELKVAYIYKITRFVRWPTAPVERPFVIGVIGAPAMDEHLRVLEREAKRVADRPIVIQSFTTPEAIAPTEILFVGAAAAHRIDAILRRTADQPTLLVADPPGAAERGIAIEVYLKPDLFRTGSGYGLQGVCERLALIDGRLVMEERNPGAQVLLWIPLGLESG